MHTSLIILSASTLMTIGQMSGKGKGSRSTEKLEHWETKNQSGVLVKRQRREHTDDEESDAALVGFQAYPGRCVELPEDGIT